MPKSLQNGVLDRQPINHGLLRSVRLVGEYRGKLYRHGFLGQPGECNHAAGVSANVRRTSAGARKPSRSINHCWL